MKPILLVLAVCGTAVAAPRPGANHHLGDDSFVARFGRMPSDADAEPLRMRVHLEYVRELLAARPATRPELAARRAELLGYLGDYIAKGTTPVNTYVPWRSPVFIDHDGNICAVGYLIERTAGRALAERIAATHRLDYLEDIAAMPEVATWIAGSGFTLDELASIQPGYRGPGVMFNNGWSPGEIVDGPYQQTVDNATITGKFAQGQMVGAWTRKVDGKVVGKGTFQRGAGTWHSYYADGTLLATGAFANSRGDGEWRFFHPSGRLSAVGRMSGGKRAGHWRFFYDDARGTVLSEGHFVKGETRDAWKHYGSDGRLVATSNGRPYSYKLFSLDIEPNAEGIRHEVHEGIPAETRRIDIFTRGKDTLTIEDRELIYDAHDRRLDKVDGQWRATKRHEETSVAVSAKEAAFVDKVLASRKKIHVPIRHVPLLAHGWGKTGEVGIPEIAPDNPAGADQHDDMPTYLADNMTWFFEWPHIDGAFTQVYQTLPGYVAVPNEP